MPRGSGREPAGRAGRIRRLLGLGALAAAGLAAAGGSSAGDALPAGPQEILARAFANRYGLDTRQVIEVVVRNASGEERRRRVAVATKQIDGRLHSLGRFLEPEYLRGTTILNIENADRSDDHFLYLRSLERIRRVSMNQRSDAFLGTDLTYEDFERRRVEDYALEMRPAAALEGERVQVVEGRPRFDSAYERAVFSVAESDGSILETRYYKRGAEEPFKIIRAPRAETRRFGDHVLPTFLVVENLARGTRTEVRIRELEIDPELDDGLFTASAIEVGRPIPGLE